MSMGQYLLFAAVNYDAAGGWEDLIGVFETETEAVEWGHKHFSGNGWWWHVVDLKEMRIMRSST